MKQQYCWTTHFGGKLVFIDPATGMEVKFKYTFISLCLHSYPLTLKEKLERMRGEPNHRRIPVAEPRTENQLFFKRHTRAATWEEFLSVFYIRSIVLVIMIKLEKIINH